jgi:hypothetical protein
MRVEEIVLVPGDERATVVTSSGTTLVPIRVEQGFDEFAAELGARTTAEVRVVDGPGLPAPGGGTIYVCRPSLLDGVAPELAPRIVVVDLERTRALDWAERLRLAAVIETDQYFLWRRRRGSGALAALYGRKDAGRRMGARWRDSPAFSGERYALLSHERHPELPALLAAYLDEYAREG